MTEERAKNAIEELEAVEEELEGGHEQEDADDDNKLDFMVSVCGTILQEYLHGNLSSGDVVSSSFQASMASRTNDRSGKAPIARMSKLYA